MFFFPALSLMDFARSIPASVASRPTKSRYQGFEDILPLLALLAALILGNQSAKKTWYILKYGQNSRIKVDLSNKYYCRLPGK